MDINTNTTIEYSTTTTVITILDAWEPYYILLIVTFGFIGNTISFLLFGCSNLRYKEASYFLAALAIADNGFLITLMIVTLHHFKLNIFDNYVLVCKLTVYSQFIFSSLSVWYVLVFTIERFIIVYFPLKRHQLCTRRRIIITLISLLILALIIYSFSLFASGLEKDRCVTYESWFPVVSKFILFDTLSTYLVPMLIVFTANLLIIVKLMKCLENNKKCILTYSSSNKLTKGKFEKRVKDESKPRLFASLFSSFSNNDSNTGKLSVSIPLSQATTSNTTVTTTSGIPSMATDITTNCNINSNGNNLDSPKSFKSYKKRSKNKNIRNIYVSSLKYKNKNNKYLVTDGQSTTESISLYESVTNYTCEKIQHDENSNLDSTLITNNYTCQHRKYFNDKNDQVSNLRNSLISSSQYSIDKIASIRTTKRDLNYSKTTKMLLIISSTFFVLHSPLAFNKLWYLIKNTFLNTDAVIIANQTHSNSSDALSSSIDIIPIEEIIERIACYTYYLNFSLNFLLYSLYGSKFRAKLFSLFKFRKTNSSKHMPSR